MSEKPDLLSGITFPTLPQQARSKKKRQAILDAALSLFGQRGYENTSISDIAEAAEVAVGGFYQFFASKRQVLLVLVDHLLEQFDQLFGAPDLTAPLAQLIESVVRNGLSLDRQYAGAYRAWREASLTDAEIKALNERVEAWLTARTSLLIQFVKSFPGARPDIDAEATAHIFTALFLSLAQEEAAANEDTIKALTAIVHHALLRDSDESANS